MEANTNLVADAFTSVTDLARKAVGTEIQTIKRVREGDVPFVVIDNDRKLLDPVAIVAAFEKTQPAPYRRRGEYKAASVESLLQWMADNCSDESPIFAKGAENLAENWTKPALSLIGIGNYSEAAQGAWHDFTVRYDFPVTLSWVKWIKQNAVWQKQSEFAEFIEEHLYEISEPQRGEELSEAVNRMIEALGGTKMVATPADIYALSTGVKLNVSEKVEVELNRATGESVMKYSEEHTGVGGRPVKIPKFFYLRVPVFFGEEPSLVGALLRYRNVGGGQVMWSYELFAPDLVVKAAFEEACAAVTKADRTLYLGSPDIPA